MRLLFDENFSHWQVEFVRREWALAEMEHMRTIGWSGKTDREWIPWAVERGFVVVTGDRNEKTRGYAVGDLKLLQARFVLMGAFWDHMTRWGKAKWLVGNIEHIANVASNLEPGSVVLLLRGRNVKAL
jgi:hypothetical protein